MTNFSRFGSIFILAAVSLSLLSPVFAETSAAGGASNERQVFIDRKKAIEKEQKDLRSELQQAGNPEQRKELENKLAELDTEYQVIVKSEMSLLQREFAKSQRRKSGFRDDARGPGPAGPAVDSRSIQMSENTSGDNDRPN